MSGEIRLGEYVKRLNKIDTKELDDILRKQKQHNEQNPDSQLKIGEIMVDMGYVANKDIDKILHTKSEAKKRYILANENKPAAITPTAPNLPKTPANDELVKKLMTENKLLKDKLRAVFNIQNKDDLLTIACAVEMIHIFSLIHDDLPCMDNDDYRRGELTCHKKFNEYDALLAGDSLIPLSFETIISKTNLSYEDKCKIILILSKAIGYKGMCLGQSLDMEFEKLNKSKTSTEAEKINIYKTGYLFKACIEIGCILGKADKNDTETLINFAINFGKAFQLADDIDDLEISNNEIEKTKIKIQKLVDESLKNLDNIKYKNKNIYSIDILKLIAKFCIS